ncbi:hypothetical protein BJ138DRAFT_1001834 [Hygrophoropsis aurantiaca]|uniref:Uncharacterized protein n=1 Tax=Hygrophoropsis aurantiaca TaxID=72124 RepID=A0ACB8AJQ2_9AGAM|nr:hypothetical protein BJ138DRAFT_1001834 [Hygrophoropsis aurantiaca]
MYHLLRIPCLFVATALFTAAYTAPNSPANRADRVQGALYERVMPIVYPIVQKLTSIIPAVAESAVILSMNFSSETSNKVMANLVLNGDLPDATLNIYFIVGVILTCAGSFGRLWCFRALGRHFTYELSILKGHKLITIGPYAYVRHPSYSTGIVAVLGITIMHASPGSFVRTCGWLDTTMGRSIAGVWAILMLLGWVLSYSRSKVEDAYLENHFKKEWDAYAKRVRYRLFPGIY